MTPQRLIVLALLVGPLLLEGCAYPSAMGRGKKAGKNGEWNNAYDHYSRAVQIKETPEALAQRDNARIKAIEQANGNIKASLSKGDVKGAAKAWDVMQKLQSVEERDYAKNDISEALLAEIQNRIDAGDPESGYKIAIAANKIFPGELFAEAALDKVRFYYRGAAEDFEAKGQFELADQMLQALIDAEPERANTVALQRGRVRESWANSLIKEGDDLVANDLRGYAAVKYIRAHELKSGGNYEALEKARELATKSTWRTALRVHVVFGQSGARARRKKFEETIKDLFGKIENAQLTTKENARLILDTDIGEADCRELKDTEEVVREYVSGQIEVPNEPYVEVEKPLKAAVAEQKKLKARMDELEPSYTNANATRARLQEELDEARAADARAGSELKRAQETLARQKERLAALQVELENASDVEKIKHLNNAAMMINQNIAQWEAAVERWTKALNDSGFILRETEAKQVKERADLEKAVVDYEIVKGEYDKITQEVRRLNNEASLVPATRMQDVMDTHKYLQTTWTMSCRVPLYATNWTAWESKLDKQQRLSITREEKDTSHPGHEPSGLEENRKDFIQTEDDLVEEADTENAKVVTEWVRQLAKEYYDQRIEKAKALIANPEKKAVATEEVVSFLVGSPSFLSEDVKKSFENYLVTTHGMKDPKLLHTDPNAAPDLPDEF